MMEDTFDVTRHLAVPEAQNREAVPLQPSGPLLVSLQPCTTGVFTSIDLNYQPLIQAGKIDDVGSDGMLAPEL